MLKLAVTLAIYAALISVSSADQAYLGEKELRDLIAGNTVHGQGLQSGTQFQSFYDPNGKWRLEQSGTSLSGTWWIKSDGVLCVVSMAGESCSAIRKNDDGTYDLLSDGTAAGEVVKGNHRQCAGRPHGRRARKSRFRVARLTRGVILPDSAAQGNPAGDGERFSGAASG